MLFTDALLLARRRNHLHAGEYFIQHLAFFREDLLTKHWTGRLRDFGTRVTNPVSNLLSLMRWILTQQCTDCVSENIEITQIRLPLEFEYLVVGKLHVCVLLRFGLSNKS